MPAGHGPVLLHVYDWQGAQVPMIVLYNRWCSSVGLFHSGLEVGGKEYAYGMNDGENTTGVFSLAPMEAAALFGHRHHSVVWLGSAPLVNGRLSSEILRELEDEWLGCRYDLLTRNCNHFCDALAERLGVQPSAFSPAPPSTRWVNRLARGGSKLIALAALLQAWV